MRSNNCANVGNGRAYERTLPGGIKKAEAAQAEAAAALAEYRAQLASAREEASRIREDAKAQAAAAAAEIRQAAQDESARMIENAKAQIEAERAHVVQSLRGEIGGLATQLAGRIVGLGTHDELLETNQTSAEIVRSQEHAGGEEAA